MSERTPEEELELRSLLNMRHYVLKRKVGEGYWREVWEGAYRNMYDRETISEEDAPVIIKIERPKRGNPSVQHNINLLKPDLTRREIEILSQTSHPNITPLIDVIQEGEKTITIEADMDAVSLEDYLSIWGPILHPEKFLSFASMIGEGLGHLHREKGYLHRDMKTANILVSKCDGVAMLSDFQNAKSLERITASCLPTRGGTAYAHPFLLNGLLRGKPVRSSVETEYYSLGIVLFEMLSGKRPFSNSIHYGGTLEENSSPDYEHIILQMNGEPREKISVQEHDTLLSRALDQEIPKMYHPLLLHCLSLRERSYHCKDPVSAYEMFQEDLAKIRSSWKRPEISIEGVSSLSEAISQQKLLSFERFLLQHGSWGVVEKHRVSDGKGSSARSHAKRVEQFTLESGPYVCTLTDQYKKLFHGTWSPLWNEAFSREITLRKNGTTRLHAQRTLGGSKRNMSGTEILKPTPYKRIDSQ